MMTDASVHERYALSFTSGALLSREAVIVAPLYLAALDWTQVRSRLIGENLLQTRTSTSGTRLVREVIQRLSVLSGAELELLIEASSSERGHLMWVAACRRYAFIGDFAEEVIHERFLLLTPSLGHDEFDSFMRGKSLWHAELAELKESTVKKLRATVFRMLVEAGLLANGEIVHAAVSERVRDALDLQTPSETRFFPIRVAKEVAL